jgi:methionine synthase reductase
LHTEATDRGVRSDVRPLNDFKDLGLKKEVPSSEGIKRSASFSSSEDVARAGGTRFVVISSTTGNGDPPDNAERFWRWVHNRSLPEDYYAGLSIAVLGLGDTNYDKFCHAAKKIRTALLRLGATEFMEPTFADEAMGLEQTVDPWSKRLWASLAKELKITLAAPEESKAPDEEAPPSGAMAVLASIKTRQVVAPAAGGMALLAKLRGQQVVVPARTTSTWELASTVTAGVRPPDDCPSWTAPPSVADLLADPKALPRLAKATVTLTNTTEAASLQSVRTDEPQGYGPEAPVSATVCAARYLTAGASSSARRVVHVELDVSGTPLADRWGPGDSVGVLCPNPLKEVELLLARLGRSPAERVVLGTDAPAHLLRMGNPVTLRNLFTWCVDIRSIFSKALVRFLAEYCDMAAPTGPRDKASLLFLSSRSARQLWKEFIETQRLTLLDVLGTFPSCTPPLQGLATLLSPQVPRFYSISSSPLENAHRFSFAFTVVTYRCGEDEPVASSDSPAADALSGSGPIVRHGLASHFLELIVGGLLRQHGASRPRAASAFPVVKAFLRPARDFRPPASLRWPIIMIGPGTGVSPFRGFLVHRMYRLHGAERQRSAVCWGEWRGGFTIDFLEDDCQETCATATASCFGCPGSLPKVSAEAARATAAAAASLSSSLGPPRGIRAAGTPAAKSGIEATVMQDGVRSLHSLRSLAGEALLFFGNRSHALDFLYKDDWEEFKRDGALTDLFTAFSRDPPRRQYVQDRLREPETARRVAESILEQGAHVFVCGDGSRMARDVHDALVDGLVAYDAEVIASGEKRSAWKSASHSLLPPPHGREGAEALLKHLAKEGRYVRDIWVG